MDLRHLRYFVSVAEHLNFTEASRQLYVAQSAISNQIAYLEESLGVKLFIRNKRTVALTGAGQVFYKDISKILNQLDEAINKVRQAESGFIGKLRVGCLGPSEKKFLPEIMKKVTQIYPQIDLSLQQYNLAPLMHALHNDEIDIAFSVSIALQDTPNLEWKKLYTDRAAVVLPANHRFSTFSKINISTLANEPFIFMSREESPQFFELTKQLCADHGFFPNIASIQKQMETILMLIEAGMGIAVLPRHLEIYANENIQFIEIDGDQLETDVVVTWRKNNQNPCIHLFNEELFRNLVLA